MSHRTEYRTCNLCEATCGLEIEVVDEAVRRIRGDRADVFSRGFVCPKGSTLRHLHEDPDRLRRPLVKRDGTFVEVEWPEAFAAVEAGLAPLLEGTERDAVAAYLGNPNVHNLGAGVFNRVLLKALGTRNLFTASTVDQMPKHVSSGLVYGDPFAIPVPDLDRTDHLLMLGANPLASNGSLATAPDFPGRLASIRERGGRVVLVDPRRTETAEVVDTHVRIRPGTDALLLAAMVTEIAAAGLVDPGPAGAHVNGLDEVLAGLAPFTADSVARATGVDPATTVALAHDFAGAATAVAYGRIGTHTVAFGTLAAWLVDVLTLVTGNLDQPGGAMWPQAAAGSVRPPEGGGRGWTTGRWVSRVHSRPEVNGEFPVADLADEILEPGEGRIRALLCLAGNPVLSCPDSNRLDRALASLDFMVAVDPYLNETTRHADVVLPSRSALEKSHYDLAFYGIAVRNVANWSPPVFDTDLPTDDEVLCTLANIVAGAGASAPVEPLYDLALDTVIGSGVRSPQSPAHGVDPAEARARVTGAAPSDRVLDAMLRCGPYGDGFGARPDGLSLARLEASPHGLDLGPLEPRLPAVLRTADARIHLGAEPLLTDLGRLAEALDLPVEPLVLVGRRHLRSNNSWMHNVEVLVKGRERCTLQVHPDDAAAAGLVDGGRARVRSRVGEVVAPVEVTDVVMPGVVSLPHGWGHDVEGARLTVAAGRPGVNTNRLTDASRIDPLSGTAVLNGIPVTLAPA